jgi:hypothetical protein
LPRGGGAWFGTLGPGGFGMELNAKLALDAPFVLQREKYRHFARKIYVCRVHCAKNAECQRDALYYYTRIKRTKKRKDKIDGLNAKIKFSYCANAGF